MNAVTSSEALVPIGTASARVGVAPSALRYYEERGLVRPAVRTGGKRWYGTEQLRRLAFVQIAKRLGFGLDTIIELFEGTGLTWRLAVDRQVEILDARIESARAAKWLLEHSRQCTHELPWRDCPYMVGTLDTWLASGGEMKFDDRELAALRQSYRRGELTEDLVDADPIQQFRTWLHDAIAAGVAEPNAMVLATADGDGVPSARTVLLKGLDETGLVFYTNYSSDKAAELDANPHAALVFPWHAMERQVRLAGPVARVDRSESAAYFATRPRESRLGAWASHQSTVVADRAALDRAYDEAEARWPDDAEIPLPDFWGGYRLRPESVEFWQGRVGRLHDRLRYRRTTEGWTLERLAP